MKNIFHKREVPRPAKSEFIKKIKTSTLKHSREMFTNREAEIQN